jgi:LPXTG-site transpeptidase (sortase) family protein
MAAAVALGVLVAGCGGQASGTSSGPAPSATTAVALPEPARTGRTAASEHVRFQPFEVVLPGSARADVVPATTVEGVLAVPDDVAKVGWWDGSAYAGDPYGSTVIAGHVDAPQQGLGYFAQLRRIRPGATIALTGQGHQAKYRVVSVRAVFKSTLSADSGPFDQTVEHRLVLITCTGSFDRATRSYDQNLVVTAVPEGPVQ